MRTTLEIIKRIENIEFESGEILDQQTETQTIVVLSRLQTQRDILEKEAEQLRWVLNE